MEASTKARAIEAAGDVADATGYREATTGTDVNTWHTVKSARTLRLYKQQNDEDKQHTKQGDRKLSPGKAGSKAKASWDGTGGAIHKEQGECKAVYAQLKVYLSNNDPKEFVYHTVQRLHAVAKEKRFQKYTQRMKFHEQGQLDEQALRAEWTDEPTAAQARKYEGLVSYCNGDNQDHLVRLKALMTTWLMEEKLPIGEIEARLHFLHLDSAAQVTGLRDDKQGSGASYIQAVRGGGNKAGPTGLTELQMKMYNLCVAPVSERTKLRQRTQEEDQALLMILNHELKVPFPPRFLVQTMKARELAIFSEIFMTLEYPLYVHMAPGQRYGDNMSKHAMLAQIHLGTEAAPAHKLEVDAFKADLSRIVMDNSARLITVYFKGRSTAEKWTNWKMPMTTRRLTLIGYEGQRETALQTHKLVRMDYYTFTIALRKGSLKSVDLHWLLEKELGLDVQALRHAETADDGLNDKEWTIRIIASACPTNIRTLSHICMDDTEMVLHHHEVYINWPCNLCYSVEHPTKYCRWQTEHLEEHKAEHSYRCIRGTVDQTRHGRAQLKVGGHPRTLEQLERLMQPTERNLNSYTPNTISAAHSPTHRSVSPNKKKQVKEVVKPTLPREWGHLHTIRTTETTSGRGEMERSSESISADLVTSATTSVQTEYGPARSLSEDDNGGGKDDCDFAHEEATGDADDCDMVDVATTPADQQTDPSIGQMQIVSTELVHERLVQLRRRLEEDGCSGVTQIWDSFKQQIKLEMKELKVAARKRMINGHRQQIKRLKQKLATINNADQRSGTQRSELLTQLKVTQGRRRVLKRRILVARSAWSSKSTTRLFFQENLHQIWR